MDFPAEQIAELRTEWTWGWHDEDQGRAAHAQRTDRRVADVLRECARSLPGKPLRRASFVLIAAALRNRRGEELIEARLRAASNRQDLLRILRIARKFARARHRGAGSGGGAARNRRNVAHLEPTSQPEIRSADADFTDAWEALEEDQRRVADGYWAMNWLGEPVAQWPGIVWGHGRPWADADAPERPTDAEAAPAVTAQAEPIDALQQRAMHWRPSSSAVLDNDLQLEQRLGVETFERLRRQVQRTDLAIESEFRAAGLESLLRSASTGGPAAVSTLDAFEAACELAERHSMDLSGRMRFDWSALRTRLAALLARPMEPSRPIQQNTLWKFLDTAPAPEPRLLLDELYDRGPGLHSSQWALLPVLLCAAGYSEDPQLPMRSAGSHLVARLLHDNWRHHRHERSAVGSLAETAWILTHGAGSSRSLDYPTFRYTSPSHPPAPQARWLQRRYQELRELGERARRDPLECFLRELEAELGDELPHHTRAALHDALVRRMVAWCELSTEVLQPELQEQRFALREKHVRRYWQDVEAGLVESPTTDGYGRESAASHPWPTRAAGLIYAMLAVLRQNELPRITEGRVDRDPFVSVLRNLALVCRDLPEVHDLADGTQLLRALTAALRDHPLEVQQDLLIPHERGLPQLRGGRSSSLEQRVREALRKALGGAEVDATPSWTTFECRPLTKAQALRRGDLGGDCSSSQVPYRCLSPHHVYYGIWLDGVQQRGYLTVYEAWATDASGAMRTPVSVLETVNVPAARFVGGTPDLLALLAAVAEHRGLSPRLVLSPGRGTWNYGTDLELMQCNAYRRGDDVLLEPADPVFWSLYEEHSGEAGYYSAFGIGPGSFRHSQGAIRMLADVTASDDALREETRAEIARIRALPPRYLAVTATRGSEPVGFVSGATGSGSGAHHRGERDDRTSRSNAAP